MLIEFNNSVYYFNKIISEEILDHSFQNFDKNEPLACFSFYVLIGFFTYFHEFFSDQKETLFRIFETQLDNTNENIKSACIYAFCSMIYMIDTPAAMYFGLLVPKVFRGLLLIENENLYLMLRDAAEAEPLFFIKRINLCLDFVEKAMKSLKNNACKYFSCEFLSILCRNTENKNLDIPSILLLIEKFMLEIGFCAKDDIEIDYIDLASEQIFKIFEFYPGLLKEYLLNICFLDKNKQELSLFVSLAQLEKLIKLIDNEFPLVADILDFYNNQSNTKLVIKCLFSI